MWNIIQQTRRELVKAGRRALKINNIIIQKNPKGGKATLGEISQEGHSGPGEQSSACQAMEAMFPVLGPWNRPCQQSPRWAAITLYPLVSSRRGQRNTKRKKSTDLRDKCYHFPIKRNIRSFPLLLTHRQLKIHIQWEIRLTEQRMMYLTSRWKIAANSRQGFPTIWSTQKVSPHEDCSRAAQVRAFTLPFVTLHHTIRSLDLSFIAHRTVTRRDFSDSVMMLLWQENEMTYERRLLLVTISETGIIPGAASKLCAQGDRISWVT